MVYNLHEKKYLKCTLAVFLRIRSCFIRFVSTSNASSSNLRRGSAEKIQKREGGNSVNTNGSIKETTYIYSKVQNHIRKQGNEQIYLSWVSRTSLERRNAPAGLATIEQFLVTRFSLIFLGIRALARSSLA